MATDDIPVLQQISAGARLRYGDIPALAHIADAPPLGRERFDAVTGWVAEVGGVILGFALIRPVDDLLYLDNISTRVEARGRGLGASLLDAVLDSARAGGFETVALTTFRSPLWNGPWFRRFGFQPLPQARIGPGLAQIIARQSLTLDPDQREVLARSVAGPAG